MEEKYVLPYTHSSFVSIVIADNTEWEKQTLDMLWNMRLSISECTRSFKKTVHMTPYEYLIKYRIKKSCELLVSSDDTITEIAGKVVFNHVNHFIQSFKKDQGRTPKGFREFRNELEKVK